MKYAFTVRHRDVWTTRAMCRAMNVSTGDKAKEAAFNNGVDLQIVKLPEAKKGFVLLPKRWVVERSFG